MRVTIYIWRCPFIYLSPHLHILGPRPFPLGRPGTESTIYICHEGPYLYMKLPLVYEGSYMRVPFCIWGSPFMYEGPHLYLEVLIYIWGFSFIYKGSHVCVWGLSLTRPSIHIAIWTVLNSTWSLHLARSRALAHNARLFHSEAIVLNAFRFLLVAFLQRTAERNYSFSKCMRFYGVSTCTKAYENGR